GAQGCGNASDVTLQVRPTKCSHPGFAQITRTTSPTWNCFARLMSGSPVASAAERAPRTSRGARAPRAPRTSAGAAPTLRAARAAARRPRRESIRPHPSSSRAPLVRAHPLVEARRARLQGDDLPLLLADQDVRDTLCEPQTGKADASGFFAPGRAGRVTFHEISADLGSNDFASSPIG